MTQPTETEATPKVRASLLARGIGLLVLSAVATVALPNATDGTDFRGRLLLAWGQQVTFWLGLICIAGFVLAEVLRRGRPT